MIRSCVPPEERIRELTAEREYHLHALENIEARIQEMWGRAAR